jgi:alkanesulfonate monooxygenase SsuD/methylene tetrahydromethanopterin reductase-like flavin-dependent oxidoreductase (luciferase family)
MEFGYFAQAFVPDFETQAEPGAEHRRIMENLDYAVECDRLGIKYVWGPEHHFLYEYSHMPAPEVYLSFVAARTQNIHVGTAITNTTPPVNHPARIAERVAMLDHLSEGRFEFGTGRGSSTTEVQGHVGRDHPRVPEDVAREVLQLRGQVLLDAASQRVAKAVHEPAPTDVGGVRVAGDVQEGG